mgnify:CR=1 FL=1
MEVISKMKIKLYLPPEMIIEIFTSKQFSHFDIKQLNSFTKCHLSKLNYNHIYYLNERGKSLLFSKLKHYELTHIRDINNISNIHKCS